MHPQRLAYPPPRFVCGDDAAHARGLAVVVDVLRAFTTAAVCVARGARQIVLVETTNEAFQLRDEHPEWLLMGESEGLPIPGFDFSNSPVELSGATVAGYTLVHRTTSGTRAAVAALNATNTVYCASLVCAATTAEQLPPTTQVTYIISGLQASRAHLDDGDDDRTVAETIDNLRHGHTDYHQCIARIKSSRAAQSLMRAGLNPDDIHLSCRPNAYPTTLKLTWAEHSLAIIDPS